MEYQPIQLQHKFQQIINSFNIKAKCVQVKVTEHYFYFDLECSNGTKVSDIKKYSNEIALALRSGLPNISILHESGVVRLSFSSKKEKLVKLQDLFSDQKPSGNLPCLIGIDTEGKNVWMDLSKNPHTIVAGTTGSGKSSLIHNIIANLINYSGDVVKLKLIDPKNIEFGLYEKLKTPNIEVSYTYDQALSVIRYLIDIMNTRYTVLKNGGTVNRFPFIVLIIDEFADLIMQDVDHKLYESLCILAQKCRAARIHIILSTQRPSVNIVNGTIKANFPARISCKVSSKVDSRVILDSSGAEALSGKGDALIKNDEFDMKRFQVAYISPADVCDRFRDFLYEISNKPL